MALAERRWSAVTVSSVAPKTSAAVAWWISRSLANARSRVPGLAALSAGDGEPLRRHLWMLAGLAVLVGLTVLAAPLFHRWYRHMRRSGADDRNLTTMYPPPAPEAAWASGLPDLRPLQARADEEEARP